jgi:uncharacterized membrane protein HdeD (DUF308 family)
MRLGLSILSGISFIFFGLACFYSNVFINEFYRYGLSEYRQIVGFFQLLGGIGCIVGIFDKRVLILSSTGLSVMMLMGVVVRIKINDTLNQTLPALLYFLVNSIICLDSIKSKKKATEMNCNRCDFQKLSFNFQISFEI